MPVTRRLIELTFIVVVILKCVEISGLPCRCRCRLDSSFSPYFRNISANRCPIALKTNTELGNRAMSEIKSMEHPTLKVSSQNRLITRLLGLPTSAFCPSSNLTTANRLPYRCLTRSSTKSSGSPRRHSTASLITFRMPPRSWRRASRAMDPLVS